MGNVQMTELKPSNFKTKIMNELMIIVFGLAVVRTLTPLIKKENFKLSTIFVAFITCWAFYHLLFNCATITFNGL
jgi:hypothetical protein